MHEYIPMDLKQESLRRQGFKGNVDCVSPGADKYTHRQNQLLMVSFFKYEQIEKVHDSKDSRVR